MTTETTKPTHGVFYTDGGCDNPNVAGWGVHGYLYLNEPAKQGTGMAVGLPTPTGYDMKGKGKPDITITHYVDGFGSITHEATNNVAELTAGLQALKLIKNTGLDHACLVMDSQYVQQGFDQWMVPWSKSGWRKRDGQSVANADLWKQMLELKTELTSNGVGFSTRWVKGHSGEVGNERADSLATAGKTAARNQTPHESLQVMDAKGFWSPKSERNRMFSLPNWYFALYGEDKSDAPDGRHRYYIGTIRDDIELVGKPIADASFAVLFLKERDPVLDIVKAGTEEMKTGRPQGVFIAYLDHIFKPSFYNELLNFGRDLLLKDRRNRRLMDRTKKLVLHEADPPGLSFRLMDHLGNLEDRLRDYLKANPKNHMRRTDITALLYEQSKSKKKDSYKLRESITTATRALKVKGCYRSTSGEDKTLSFVLTMAQDLPDRNTLGALAGEQTKVTLVTWPESLRAVRFAVVIESNDGDLGIWAGPYSNLQMLPP